MGLLDFLSPGLTAATQVASGYQGAQAQAARDQRAAMIERIKQQQAQQSQTLKDLLTQAQTKNTLRTAGQLRLGDPGYADAKREESGAIEGGKTPELVKRADEMIPGEVKKQDALTPGAVTRAVKTAEGVAPVHTKEAVATAAGVAPIHTKEAVETKRQTAPIEVATEKAKLDLHPFAAVTPTGSPNGTFVKPSDAFGLNKVKPGGGGSATGAGGMGQGVQARLLAAVAEARAASKRMDAYENKMLADPIHATPNFGTQLGGKLATRMAGQHSITGLLGETAGESFTDPAYLQYVRDAGLMARATQLMSSRGGSESMVSAEQLLNRAVPNPGGLKGSVDAARQSRNAIFGPVGGLMQAFTPEQIAKIEAGLAALEKGEASSPAYRDAAAVLEEVRVNGSSGASQQGAPVRPLTPAQIQRAQTDSTYRTFLIDTGKMPGGK